VQKKTGERHFGSEAASSQRFNDNVNTVCHFIQLLVNAGQETYL
jgi:hypothetical protein